MVNKMDFTTPKACQQSWVLFGAELVVCGTDWELRAIFNLGGEENGV